MQIDEQYKMSNLAMEKLLKILESEREDYLIDQESDGIKIH